MYCTDTNFLSDFWVLFLKRGGFLKVQLSINDELMKKVDKYAEENYISRSTFFALSATQYINQQELASAVKGMALSMRRIADNNVVDSDTLRELSDFEKICKSIYGL